MCAFGGYLIFCSSHTPKRDEFQRNLTTVVRALVRTNRLHAVPNLANAYYRESLLTMMLFVDDDDDDDDDGVDLMLMVLMMFFSLIIMITITTNN